MGVNDSNQNKFGVRHDSNVKRKGGKFCGKFSG